MVLCLATVAVRDTRVVQNGGILGELQCRLWNTKFLMWGLFKSSTWNLVTLTFER